MSPVEFEDMNTSPSFPGSSFSPIPSSPWSQIFKRAKSSTKEEKSGFLGKLKGKQKERDMSEDADRVKWREEMRGKIRVLGTVNMTSAFEDD
jgi:hypothetical protein